MILAFNNRQFHLYYELLLSISAHSQARQSFHFMCVSSSLVEIPTVGCALDLDMFEPNLLCLSPLTGLQLAETSGARRRAGPQDETV